jgi:hypothetical protein
VRPDRPVELVDEGVDVLIGFGPVEATLFVGDVAVERRKHQVRQLGHGPGKQLTGRGDLPQVAVGVAEVAEVPPREP